MVSALEPQKAQGFSPQKAQEAQARPSEVQHSLLSLVLFVPLCGYD
jgi:hypothetical protein